MDIHMEASNKLINWNLIQTETEKVIRQHSRTFYFATALLPHKMRLAIRALYAFCRRTDDLVDQRGATLTDLENWRKQVNQPITGQTDSVLLLWSRVKQEYDIDQKFESELIDGVAMDLQFKAFETWNDLERYCYHVASTVGLLSIPIIGLAKNASPAQAQKYAIQLGIALQLTNILRDIGEDFERGRFYLPLEDLNRFGLTLHDIHSKTVSDKFKMLMRFEIERARQLYDHAIQGITLLNKKAQPAVASAAILYKEILDEIEKLDFQVFTKRAHTTTLTKIFLLPKILFTIWTLKPPVS